MKYHIIAVFVMCLILGTGLVSAGTLTVSLEPSFNSKGDIKATSITDAKLCDFQGICVLNGVTYKAATIINGTAQFNLSDRDAGARLIWIKTNLNPTHTDVIPTRIDDPTKDINQFLGHNLTVSVIGNLSDPVYRIKTFTIGQGYDNPTVNYYNPTDVGALNIFSGDVYAILSLKINPQKFEVITLGSQRAGRGMRIIDYAPTSPTHPNTSTSINPSFSKWMFGEGNHGNDYGGNDSKCSTCHGNLDTKLSKFSEITVDNGFCFRCHYGKGGPDKGFVVDTIGLGVRTPASTIAGTPAPTTAKLTAIPTTSTPKTPAFEALSAIAALLAVLL